MSNSNPAKQISVASDGTNGAVVGEVDPSGNAWVQEGSGSRIQLPYTGVSRIAVASDPTNGPLVAILVNGTAYAYQGSAGGLTSAGNGGAERSGGVTSVAVATDPTHGPSISVLCRSPHPG
ncbi:hypothetical protein [Kitasatospora sp. NPDC085464]|uniref:hypothetical protein n=1 Tax=Kitasatospora sp. NPDC085464 TaxID=3364063 RepID=UPI0037CAF10E